MRIVKTTLFALLCSIILLSCSSSSEDPCDNVACVNGNCNSGACDCDAGYSGTLCDNEMTPVRVSITQATISKYPAKQANGSPWDEKTDEDGENPDLTFRVYSLSREYFSPSSIATQVAYDADQKSYSFPCDFSIDKVNEQITFEIADYDVKGFDFEFQLMYSMKKSIKELSAGHPAELVLSSDKMELKLKVEYTF